MAQVGRSSFSLLALTAPWPEARVDFRKGERTKPEQGFVMRRQTWHNRLRRFHLRWPNMTDGQRYWLTKLWDDTFGGVLLMDYKPMPECSTSFSVRFAHKPIVTARTYGRSWQADVTLEEVR